MTISHRVWTIALMGLAGLATSAGCARTSSAVAGAASGDGVVVSVCEIASRVGVDTLRQGGNAVDSAVAVAFALAVTHPAAGNIGGGGFMLVYPAHGDKPVCIEYRETAPAASIPDMLANAASTDARMVGIPGTVRGLALAHEKYGRLKWKELVQPAVTLAESGFPVSAGLARSLNEVLKEHPASASLLATFAAPDRKQGWTAGDRLVQRELAGSLRLIAEGGPGVFYEGPIAKQIVAEVSSAGGIIQLSDLAAYRAVVREPIRGTYRGYDIFAAPPPSSGGIALVEMLNMLETVDLRRDDRWSTRSLHLIVECMRRAYRDRAEHLGDPDFVSIPSHLTDKAYARTLVAAIDPSRATPSESLAGSILIRGEGESTTHFSIVDRDGMAVSNTYTLEDSYGSKIVVRGAGFLLNNEMGDFNPRPGVTDRTGRIGTPANLIRPGKRMLSSQTPVVVARDGKVVLVTGSPGGRTIINTVLCVVLNALEFEMSPRASVEAPRMHHQWFPDEVVMEPSDEGPSSVTLAELRAMGHRIRTRKKSGATYVQGGAHSIFLRDGVYRGITDSRAP